MYRSILKSNVSTLALAFAVVSSCNSAFAACTNTPPATGQAVDCTGTGNPAAISPAGATGVNVTVESGASITTEATGPGNVPSAISVNDNGTIVNNGTILPTLTVNATHQSVNLNGSNTSLVNNGTILLNNTGSNGAITNKTLYAVTASSPSPANAGSTSPYANVSVVNHGTISIQQNGTGTASTVYTGEDIDSMTVENLGTISLIRTGGSLNGTRVGAVGSDDDTDDYTIINHEGATISASGTNVYGVLGRSGDLDLTNAGAITTSGNARGAIVIYGGADDGPATATIVNKSTGVITGNVIITDGNPFNVASTTPGSNVGASVTADTSIRDSTFNNKGTVDGGFTYGAGTHVLHNSGTITGPIYVLQAALAGSPGGAPVGIGGASFTLTNSGTLGGDITIRDRSDSVNDVTLRGTGFSGNVVAVNGAGSNSLTLQGVTTLASVQQFTNLNLNQSNVAVAGGVSLQSNAGLATTIYGPGGTRGAPSTSVGTINGTLTLAGPTTITPTYNSLVRSGDVYQVASTVAGAGAGQVTVKNGSSALVHSSADTSTGKLLLVTDVRNANTISGLNQPGVATLNGLLTYKGTNPQVLEIGALVENLHNDAAVRGAATALAPITNGADIQTVINSATLFAQQIDSRLDAFVYAQIPSSGRSADLGVGHAVPVYGALPTSGAWVEGIGGGANQRTAAGVNGYNATLEGVVGGYDRLIVPGVRLGGAFGYVDGRVNNNASGGTREDIQTYQGLAYASWEQPNYYLRGSVGYGGVNFQSSRQIAFATFNDIATGRHSGNVLTTRGEVGLPYEYLSSLLVPYAAFTYNRLGQNGYTEVSGNGAGFSYQGVTNNSERSEVGGKVIVPLTGAPLFSYLFPGGSVVALEGRAAYVHEFGNVGQTVVASFAGTGNVFVAAGPAPNRDMVDYGVGLRMGSGPVQIDLSYNGLARSTYLQQVGLLRARYVF